MKKNINNNTINKKILKYVLHKHFGIEYYDLVHNHLLHTSYNNSYLNELLKYY